MGTYRAKSCGKRHAYCGVCRPDVAAKASAALDGHRGKARRGRLFPGTGFWSGKTISNETRAKISAAVGRSLIGNKRALGNRFTHTPEARAKISRAVKDAYARGIFDGAWRRKIAHGVAKAHTRGDYRRGPTSLEYALQLLLESAGLGYEAQVRFGRYVVDFWVPRRALVFEADGMFWYHHQDKKREARRDAYLRARGAVEVVHLQDNDLEDWKVRL